MKNIFYIISIVVIAAAAFFGFSNAGKIQAEIDEYATARDKKRNVENSIAETEKDLEDTGAALDESKNENSRLSQSLDNENSKEQQYKRSIDKFDAEIEGLDAELKKLAEIEDEIKKKLGDLEWDEIAPTIKGASGTA